MARQRDLPPFLRQIDADGYQTVAEFESWDAWVNHCDQPSPNFKGSKSSRERNDDDDHGCFVCDPKVPEGEPKAGWHGSRNFKEALKQARGKSDTGIEKMRKYLGVMNTKIGERIMQPQYYLADSGGGEIDMGAYTTGVPEIYMQSREHYTIGPSNETALIFFHMGYSSNVSPDVVATRGAVALALASLFEQGGVPTRIVCALGKDNKYRHSVLINFKDYGQALDMPSASYAFCNPGANRRLGFSHYEQLPPEEIAAFNIGVSYHQPRNAQRELIPDEAIVFHHGEYNDNWSTPERAQKWIEELLTSKGIDLVREGE